MVDADAKWEVTSEHLYRAVVLSSSEAIIIFDRHEIIRDFSPAAEELFGYASSEVVGKPFAELFPPRLRIGVQGHAGAWIQHALISSDRLQLEGLHRDGHEIEIEVGVNSVSTGDYKCYCASIRDLTESMLAFEIEAKRSLLQSLVADCTATLVSRSEKVAQAIGRIASFLEIEVTQMFKVRGEGDERVLIRDEGWCDHDVLPARVEGGLALWEGGRFPTLLEALGRGEIVQCAVRDAPSPALGELMKLADIASLLVLPIITDKRLDSIWVFECHDDERVWAEYELHLVDSMRLAIARHVERTNADRELRSTWLQLREALKTAEDAVKAKSEFIANVSHEIRSPMTAVVGYSEMLALKFGSDSKIREWSDLIRHNGEHLLSLVNDILDFSKIEAGRLVISPAPMDVRAAIDGAMSALRWAADRKGLTLRVLIDDAVPGVVQCDPLRFRQIIVNFGSNAIKFTKGGHVEIRVHVDDASPTREESPAGVARLCVEVEDSGIGIAREKISKLFSTFTQVHSGLNDFGGTGLGLAITYQLVKQMGGRVDVASELGVGSTFSAELPVEVLDHDYDASPSRDDDAEFTTFLQGKRVLVVDDVDANRELFKLILEEAGVVAITADDGEHALGVAAREHVDFILMDVHMPGKDGLEVTRELRQSGSEVPIVALTASALDEDAQRCFEAGCDGYITKPVQREDFLESVAASLRAEPVEGRPAPHEEIAVPALPRIGELEPMFSDLPDQPAYRELLDAYVAALPGMRSALEDAFELRDHAALLEFAHKLTGSAGCYGFPQVSSAASCLQLELGETQDLDEVEDLVEQLQHMLARAIAGAEVRRGAR